MAVSDTSAGTPANALAAPPAGERAARRLPAARRQATPRATPGRAAAPSRGRRVLRLLLAAAALSAAFGAGVLITRRHYHAQEVVASINGAVIDKGAFYRRLELASGPQVIRAMASEALTLEFARQKGVMPTERDVDAHFAQASAQAHFADMLAANGQTPEEYKQALRVQMARTNIVGKGVTVSDADVRKFYEANVDPKNPQARYFTPERAQIAVIVTRTQAQCARAAADLGHGLPFGTVAQTYSQDRSKDNGGLLPIVPRGRTASTKVPGLESAIFGMKIGDQIGPRQFAGAWWIIRCLDKKPQEVQAFDKVKDDCRTGALLVKGIPANGQSIEREFQEFQKKASIQAFWPQYRQALAVGGSGS